MRIPILGSLLKQGIKLHKSIEQNKKSPFDLQKKQLYNLLNTSKETSFGQKYKFADVLALLQAKGQANEGFYEAYKSLVPIFDYNKIYNEWWSRAIEGEKNVTWRGAVKYFALSSGTSESASKHIPITRDMLKSIHRTSIRQILALSNYKEVPAKTYGKGMLMLGGCIHLNKKGSYFEGDLSGITASQIPFWFQHWYKPGKKIARNVDWDDKLKEITLKAPKWDIGFIVGVPAWIQIMMENIIEHYKVNNIHEIWKNLTVYTHGGVAFDPYRKSFENLFGKPVTYIETYLASEGFIAFQRRPNANLDLVLNQGIFLEFIPFNEKNFDVDGMPKPNAETYMIHQIEENKEYAILLSTCAGTWRYLIGDTVKLINKKYNEIIITGRTKHFLSLCGEHLSVDNMNKAIQKVSSDMNFRVDEFTVVGIPHDTLFAHHWFIGTDKTVDDNILKEKLDTVLKSINDDYKVERDAALKEIFVKTLPNKVFYDWMRTKGKIGGQSKFPRVMKTAQYQEWLSFINQ